MLGGIGLGELIILLLIAAIIAIPLIIAFTRKKQPGRLLVCVRCGTPLASPTAVCTGCQAPRG